MSRALVAVLVALVTGSAAAEGPPAPPPGHEPVALATGASWSAPPGGGVCLDITAATYQVERRRWDEERLRAAMALAEDRPVKVVAWSVGVGVVVGAAAVLLVRSTR